jgi:hypothetical protein
MGIAPDVVMEVGLVSGQVTAVVAQIALDDIDIMLLVTAEGIPVPCRTPVALLDGSPYASRVVVALCSLLSQVRLVAARSIKSDVASVAVNVALGKCR